MTPAVVGIVRASELGIEERAPTPLPLRQLIRSRYAGRCAGCGAPYAVDTVIAWSRGRPAICVNCARREVA
jgi:hypothetical protein